MIKFGFYILGEKGYKCLADFISVFGVSGIAFVKSSRDINIKEDFYAEIRSMCHDNEVPFFDKNSRTDIAANYSFAIGWRWIIENTHNLIVFHDSLLPKYRGFAPLVNGLINGEEILGVTALFASQKFDEGRIISQTSFPVLYPAKIAEIIKTVTKLYSNQLIKIATMILEGKALYSVVQNELDATYSPWRDNDDYIINWSLSSSEISRFVDAVGYPYSGAQTKIGIKTILVNESKIVDDVFVENRHAHVGKVLFMLDGLPVVICGSGLLKLLDFVDEEGQPLMGKIQFRTRFGGQS